MKAEQTKLHVQKKNNKIFSLVRHGRSARDRSYPQMEQFRFTGTDNYM